MASSNASRRAARLRALRADRKSDERPPRMRIGRDVLVPGLAAGVTGAGGAAAMLALYERGLFGDEGDDAAAVPPGTGPGVHVRGARVEEPDIPRALDVFGERTASPRPDTSAKTSDSAVQSSTTVLSRTAPQATSAAPTSPAEDSALPATPAVAVPSTPERPAAATAGSAAPVAIDVADLGSPSDAPVTEPGAGNSASSPPAETLPAEPSTPPDSHAPSPDHDTPQRDEHAPPPPPVYGDDEEHSPPPPNGDYVEEAPPPPPPIDRMSLDEFMGYYTGAWLGDQVDWERAPQEVIDYYNPGGDELSMSHQTALNYDLGVFGPDYWYYAVSGQDELPPPRYETADFHGLVNDPIRYREAADLNGDGEVTDEEAMYFLSHRMPAEGLYHYDEHGTQVISPLQVDNVLAELRSTSVEEWADLIEGQEVERLSVEEFYDELFTGKDFEWINSHAPKDILDRYDVHGDGRISPVYESWAFYDDLFSVDREDWIYAMEHGIDVVPDPYTLGEVWAVVQASEYPTSEGELAYWLAMRAPEELAERYGYHNFHHGGSVEALAADMAQYADAEAWAAAVAAAAGNELESDAQDPQGEDGDSPGFDTGEDAIQLDGEEEDGLQDDDEYQGNGATLLEEPMTLEELGDWETWTDEAGMSGIFGLANRHRALDYFDTVELSQEVLDRYDGNGDGNIDYREYMIIFTDLTIENGLFIEQPWQDGRLTLEAFHYYGQFDVAPREFIVGDQPGYWPPAVVEYYGLDPAAGPVPYEVMQQIQQDAIDQYGDYEGWLDLMSQPPGEQLADGSEPDEQDHGANGNGFQQGENDLATGDEEEPDDPAVPADIERMTMEEFYQRADEFYLTFFESRTYSMGELNEMQNRIPEPVIERFDSEGDGILSGVELEQALKEAQSAMTYDEWQNWYTTPYVPSNGDDGREPGSDEYLPDGRDGTDSEGAEALTEDEDDHEGSNGVAGLMG